MGIVGVCRIGTNCNDEVMRPRAVYTKKGEDPVLADTLTSFQVGVMFPLETIMNFIS
jgi:hypothetical protein